ncbi:MAG: hypothetical protein DLM73_07915 [Chthoniobacterales bacterium]|nr:MAG: hypothetical protein DLM73_07915 [Chthoniobacterales bacterium]
MARVSNVKWFLTHVAVPLIGAGGITSIILALVGHRDANKRQDAVGATTIQGSNNIAVSGNGNTVTVQSPGPNSETMYEITFWNTVSAQNHPEELKIYLDQFPKGRFSALALIRLKNRKASNKTLDDLETEASSFILSYFEGIGVKVYIVSDHQRARLTFSTERSYAKLIPGKRVWEKLVGQVLLRPDTCFYGLEMFYASVPESSPPDPARFLLWTDASNPDWKNLIDSFGHKLSEQLSTTALNQNARN